MVETYILATDPRGLQVEFWKERWEWITLKHPDLLTKNITPEHLKKAIEKPAEGCIFSSNDKRYKDCCLYYLRISQNLQIRVVVKFDNNKGEIPTAHFLKDRSSGENIIWMIGK